MVPKAKAFILLYRGSRDGFKSKAFLNKCADKGPTFTICKTKSISLGI